MEELLRALLLDEAQKISQTLKGNTTPDHQLINLLFEDMYYVLFSMHPLKFDKATKKFLPIPFHERNKTHTATPLSLAQLSPHIPWKTKYKYCQQYFTQYISYIADPFDEVGLTEAYLLGKRLKKGIVVYGLERLNGTVPIFNVDKNGNWLTMPPPLLTYRRFWGTPLRVFQKKPREGFSPLTK